MSNRTSLLATDASSEAFYALTPDRVLAAVEAGGLRATGLCYPLNSFENRVYEVELEDRSRVIAKFYRPGRWSEEQILEEHRFLAELHDEEIPVCTVRPFPDGGTLKATGEIFYSLSDRRGGRAPDELGDEEVRRLGRLVARLHNVGARRDAPSRHRLDADSFVREPVAWLRSHEAVPVPFRDRYFATAEQIADVADRRMSGFAVHRLHADLHLGNLLFRDQELRILDFDDMAVGPAVQDLWLMLPGRDPVSVRQRQLLVETYEQLREFDHRSLQLIEPLRGLRMVHFAAWLARRFSDPAFRIAWPEFGSEEYWRRETEDLEDQLRYIQGETSDDWYDAPPGSPRVGVEDEPPVLSNKDYFWDWEGE